LLLGGGGSRYGFWLQVLPIDVARHHVIWHLVAHPSQLDRFGSERTCELMDMLGGVHEEDMAACARVQAGLASGLLERFRLAPLESTLADFQRWVSERLRS
jgi:hypothetical protein